MNTAGIKDISNTSAENSETTKETIQGKAHEGRSQHAKPAAKEATKQKNVSQAQTGPTDPIGGRAPQTQNNTNYQPITYPNNQPILPPQQAPQQNPQQVGFQIPGREHLNRNLPRVHRGKHDYTRSVSKKTRIATPTVWGNRRRKAFHDR